jgi:hypothetical protein
MLDLIYFHNLCITTWTFWLFLRTPPDDDRFTAEICSMSLRIKYKEVFITSISFYES